MRFFIFQWLWLTGYWWTYPEDVLTCLRLQHVDSDSVGRLRLLTSDKKRRKMRWVNPLGNIGVLSYSCVDSGRWHWAGAMVSHIPQNHCSLTWAWQWPVWASLSDHTRPRARKSGTPTYHGAEKMSVERKINGNLCLIWIQVRVKKIWMTYLTFCTPSSLSW